MVDISYKELRDIYEGQNADVDTRAFNSSMSIQREWHREKLRHVMRNVSLKNKFVLDAGCGSGAFSRALARKARRVVGIDINKFAVASAADKGGSFFIPANIERIPFADSSFDVVVCLDALDHCLKPRDVVKEFSRVLKKGGKGIVIVQNHTRAWRFVEYMWDRFGKGREYGHVHVSRFDKGNIKDPFNVNGVMISDIYSIHHISPLLLVRKPWTYPDLVEKKIRKMMMGLSIVVVIEKV